MPGGTFLDPSDLVAVLNEKELDKGISQLLMEIERQNVRDSTTIIAWNVEVEKEGSIPSDYLG